MQFNRKHVALFGAALIAMAPLHHARAQDEAKVDPKEANNALMENAQVQKAEQMPMLQKKGSKGEGVPDFTVRAGYRVTLASPNLGEARFMEWDDKGTLFVSQPNKGKIIALTDKNNDGVYDAPTDFIEGKNSAHGMHWNKGWLWFTQSGAIYRARDTNNDGKADEVVTVIPEGELPKNGHWWRTILVTDDGFFTSIGDSGNASDETATDRQKIWFYALDGKTRKLWSSGIRNTEKLRFRPGTTELYGSDHGSDNFGKEYGEKDGNQPITDRIPPEEFNYYREGHFYGHPFITAQGVPRPEYAKRPDIVELSAKTTAPAWNMGAHWAVNGWTFTTKNTLGNAGDAYMASHGSWNSSVKSGYRIERIMFDDMTGKPMGAQMMVSTLTPDGKNSLARPVDCLEAPDGSLLFSDDQTNRVYRLAREK